MPTIKDIMERQAEDNRQSTEALKVSAERWGEANVRLASIEARLSGDVATAKERREWWARLVCGLVDRIPRPVAWAAGLALAVWLLVQAGLSVDQSLGILSRVAGAFAPVPASEPVSKEGDDDASDGSSNE